MSAIGPTWAAGTNGSTMRPIAAARLMGTERRRISLAARHAVTRCPTASQARDSRLANKAAISKATATLAIVASQVIVVVWVIAVARVIVAVSAIVAALAIVVALAIVAALAVEIALAAVTFQKAPAAGIRAHSVEAALVALVGATRAAAAAEALPVWEARVAVAVAVCRVAVAAAAAGGSKFKTGEQI